MAFSNTVWLMSTLEPVGRVAKIVEQGLHPAAQLEHVVGIWFQVVLGKLGAALDGQHGAGFFQP